MITLERKTCAACGEFNLKDEGRCWACGSTRFAGAGAQLAGDATICLGDALHTTQEWERQRPTWLPLALVGAGFGFALFMCILGFWIGRASAPESSASAAQPASVPITLPSPPTGIAVTPPGSYAPPGPGQPRAADPKVQVRSMPGSAPQAVTPPPPATAGVAPSTIVTPTPRPSAVIPPTSYVYAPPTVPLPDAQPVMPSASGKTSVVSLRNDSSTAVDVTFEGEDTRTARVGAGSTMPLILPPGSYQLRASGAGAASARSTVILTAGRTYSLTVDGRRENGKMTLVVIEPAIDGTGE
jgi:hypothetical protein